MTACFALDSMGNLMDAMPVERKAESGFARKAARAAKSVKGCHTGQIVGAVSKGA